MSVSLLICRLINALWNLKAYVLHSVVPLSVALSGLQADASNTGSSQIFAS